MPSITLTVDAANAARITAAFGRILSLVDANGAPRDATLAEVKSNLAKYAMGIVRGQEAASAAAAITDTVIT